MLFIRTRHSLGISGVIPFVKLQNGIETAVKQWKNNEKWDGKFIHLPVFGWAVVFSVQCLEDLFLFFSVYSTQYLVSTKNNYISEDVCTN